MTKDTAKTTHRAITPPDFHDHELPAKDKTMMKRVKVDAFKTAPAQSMVLSFVMKGLDGSGLSLGNRKT